MVSRLKFRPRLSVMNPPGTPKRRESGLVDRPSKGVGRGDTPETPWRGKASADPSLVESAGEKSWGRSCQTSVP